MWASRAAASSMLPTIRALFRHRPGKIRVVLRRSPRFPVFDPSSVEQGVEMLRAPSRFLNAIERRLSCVQRARVCHSSTFVDVAEKTQGAPVKGFANDDSRWVIFPARSYRGHKSTADWRRLPMSFQAHALPRRPVVWHRKIFLASIPSKITAMRRKSASRAAACRPRMRKSAFDS